MFIGDEWYDGAVRKFRQGTGDSAAPGSAVGMHLIAFSDAERWVDLATRKYMWTSDAVSPPEVQAGGAARSKKQRPASDPAARGAGGTAVPPAAPPVLSDVEEAPASKRKRHSSAAVGAPGDARHRSRAVCAASSPRVGAERSRRVVERSLPAVAFAADMLVGMKVRVKFGAIDQWFTGRVISYDRNTRTHKIVYDDGDTLEQSLAIDANGFRVLVNMKDNDDEEESWCRVAQVIYVDASKEERELTGDDAHCGESGAEEGASSPQQLPAQPPVMQERCESPGRHRSAEAKAKLGRTIQLYFPVAREWHRGMISLYDETTNMFHVDFDDGTSSLVNLEKRRVRWDERRVEESGGATAGGGGCGDHDGDDGGGVPAAAVVAAGAAAASEGLARAAGGAPRSPADGGGVAERVDVEPARARTSGGASPAAGGGGGRGGGGGGSTAGNGGGGNSGKKSSSTAMLASGTRKSAEAAAPAPAGAQKRTAASAALDAARSTKRRVEFMAPRGGGAGAQNVAARSPVRSRGAALVKAAVQTSHRVPERGTARRGVSAGAAAGDARVGGAYPGASAAADAGGMGDAPRDVRTLLSGVCVLLTGFSNVGDATGASLWPSACRHHVATPTLDDLRARVARLGGTVVNTLLDVEHEDVRSLVIAHPASLRSMKYLFALARGCPPIHWQWLLHCECDSKLWPLNRCASGAACSRVRIVSRAAPPARVSRFALPSGWPASAASAPAAVPMCERAPIEAYDSRATASSFVRGVLMNGAVVWAQAARREYGAHRGTCHAQPVRRAGQRRRPRLGPCADCGGRLRDYRERARAAAPGAVVV